MSVSPSEFFYTDVSYVDTSNALINFSNLTGNAELNEHPLSKYARGIFFSPNYNKQFFDAINWANNLGDYKTQLNLINPYNDNVLENLQNNNYLDHIYFGLAATNNTSTNDDVWKFDGFKILQDNVNIITPGNPYIFDKANGDWSTHWDSTNKPVFYTQANIPINSNQLTLEYNKSANSSPETTIPSKYPPFYWDYNGDLNTQQGYVIKASSEYSNHTKHLKYNPFLITTPGSANSLPGNYYNRGWLSIWQPDGIDSGTHGNVLSGIDTGSSTGGVASRNGPWLQMSFPFPIKVTTVDMYHNDDDLNDRITEGYFYGSNDEITYYELVQLSSSSDNLNSYTKTSKNTITINSEIAYKHLLLQITAQNTIRYVEVGKMEIFGIKPGFENTPTSGHIVSSESPDGPWIVRASWNTAEELINTGSYPLSILKYPTWIDDTYIPTFGQSSPISQEGYTIKASSEWHGWSGIYEKWQPFYMTVDKLTTSSDAGWLSVDNTINSNGYANNSNMLSGIDQNTSTNNVTTRNGPWLQLSLPNTIKLTTVDMYSRHDRDRIIEGYFYGSNDETTWYELVEISSASDNLSGYDNTSKNTVTINSNVEYKHYIYQVTRAMKKYGSVKKLDYYSSINNVPIPIQL